ncbi:hypothetical protein PAMP_004486 [Pampus punctatissimus]
MSRSDYPPGYNDSYSQLYGSQGRNYPQPPEYGFPGFSGPHPGQPSAPYPTGTEAPLYSGQPHPAGPPGAGYPNYPPMPPIVPPTIPTDVLSSVRLSKCSYTKTQLCTGHHSDAVYIVTHLVLICCQGPRRKFPWNIILLLIFTLALSYMTGSISSYYNTKAVFLALVITAIVCIAVTVFCFQTKVDFTKCHGLLCVLAIVIFVTGIITSIVLAFKYIKWLHMLFAALGAITFTLFLAYHTQLLIGNRKYSISPEEYVFAALSLYVDIVQIFLFLLQIIGASSR